MIPEVMGKIEHIVFHPVKSAAAIKTKRARLTKEGIEGDRQFMIVRTIPDKDGIFNFVTQRDKRDELDKPQGLSIMSLGLDNFREVFL